MVRRVPLRAALAASAVLLLLAGGWLWLRDSSLVRVRDVYVLGLSAGQEREIRDALRATAIEMTTLHVREEQLELAVARFPQVADLRVQTDFPREMTIEVIEHRPVAAVALGGVRVPVSAAGRLMRGMRVEGDLPLVRARRLSAESRVADERALSAIAALGRAPETLRGRIVRAWFGPRGLTFDMQAGPDVVLGSHREADRKWAAVTRVLAEPEAAGAVYLDARVPGRVAAGGLLAQPLDSPEGNPQPEPENPPTLNPQ